MDRNDGTLEIDYSNIISCCLQEVKLLNTTFLIGAWQSVKGKQHYITQDMKGRQ